MKINQIAINYARSIAAETISKAKSGHTGTSVGAATIFYALFKDHYHFNNKDSRFLNRDRLVVSAGHCSALYYTMMHMFDMGVTIDDLKNFRRLGSKTPGHPEFDGVSFVETSTGPLGQGVANAVGMAIGETIVSEKFNAQKFPIINNYTYCFVGDGCLMEGVANEAISLAGHLKLNKLILLYDYNKITIDGKLNISNSEKVSKKFKAQGWNVIRCRCGNNYLFVTRAIARAKRSKKPTIIIFDTVIGYKTRAEGTSKIHGKPLSQLELDEYKIALKTQGSFYIPQEIYDFCFRTVRKNNLKIDKWTRNVILYEKTHPDLYKQFVNFWENPHIDFEKFTKYIKEENLSGREANKIILNAYAGKNQRFVGGTADVAPSTMSFIDNKNVDEDYSSTNRRGRNIHFGVREHSMGAICNGISLYLNSPVFCSTFLAFSNYMIPPIRMSALMNLPVMYFFTHDSFRVGEDGPTHQPVEQLAQLRAIPNLNVFRPCDMTEIIASYQIATKSKQPSAFVLSRQILPHVSNNKFDKILKGGYLLDGDSLSDVSIYASGSEVEIAMQVKQNLTENNISCSVFSMPSLSVFNKQSTQYKNSVLNKDAKLKVVIEAGNDTVWYSLLGKDTLYFNITEFGHSGKLEELEKHLGYNANIFARKIINTLRKKV